MGVALGALLAFALGKIFDADAEHHGALCGALDFCFERGGDHLRLVSGFTRRKLDPIAALRSE